MRLKSLLRSKVYFPGIDKAAENNVESCLACQATIVTSTRPPPLQMSHLPHGPWEILSADFFSPIATSRQYLLVITDDYSRYPVVEILFSTSADSAIPAFERAFALFGGITRLRTDNGPPWNSKQFTDYAHASGFHHRKINPLHPSANGIAERMMKSQALSTNSRN